MRRILAVMLGCVLICGSFAGCSWLDGHYSSVKPHLPEQYEDSKSVVIVSSYIQLRQALVDMVKNGTKSGVITISDFAADKVEKYMHSAVEYVTTKVAIGAYAVDQISFELGTNAGLQAVAVNISYTHERSEILRMKRAANVESAKAVIFENLDKCNAGVVVLINDYEETDFLQMIADYARLNPDTVMELPAVSVVIYPDTGKERVVEIFYTYQNSREDLRDMQQKVLPIFTAAELYVRETRDPREKYVQLYSFLMERFEQYTVQASITPSYSLLMYGVGDSKAFADVYAAMCDRAGVPCHTVSGTRNGEAWYWNVIEIDEKFYHVDLLQCAQSGVFQERTDIQMTGYVWDYSEFATSEE